MSDNIMTRQGYEILKEKLRRLKIHDRQEVIEQMRVAAAHGDLSENAEYDAAKERQMFVESKIREIEQKLARAKVIDTSNLPTDKVVFGVTVHLNDDDRDEAVVYQIVGVDEADVGQGKISISSPLARALIGKSIGDSVSVKTPGGVRNYTILDITCS